MGVTIDKGKWLLFWEGIDQDNEQHARQQFEAKGTTWPDRPVLSWWQNLKYSIGIGGNRGVYWQDVWERRPQVNPVGNRFEPTVTEQAIVTGADFIEDTIKRTITYLVIFFIIVILLILLWKWATAPRKGRK